jgi:hypothetical protein
MTDWYTTEMNAIRKRIDAERHAERERLIRSDRSEGDASIARDGESQATTSFLQRVHRGLLAALARPRAAVLPR